MCVYRRMGIVLLISCMVLVLGSCGGKKTDMTEVADRVEKMVTGNNPLQVKTVSQDKYAYNTLDDATKLVYDEILYAIVHRKRKYRLLPQMWSRWSLHIWRCGMITVICSG